MTTPAPEAGDIAAPPPGDEAACRRAAKRLREKYPRWVVIWVARTARYHAYPLASSRAGSGQTDTAPAGLGAKIEQAERVQASRHGRLQHTSSTTR
jgi:hypothetical protein